jgi:anthranilate phosphoribosyltransferase
MMEQIKLLMSGQTLSEDDMGVVVRQLVNGRVADDLILQFLNAFGTRDETVDELVGAARALRETMLPLKAPYATVDCCGTGGDLGGTLNISTAVALVAAGAGVPVAKHGNRASTSRSGAADVLEALGVKLDMPIPALEQTLRELNFAFLMAPAHHKGIRHVAAARKKIGRRTIFNIIGPLANPASVRRQLLGVYDKRLLIPMAETLKRLGSRRAWVVHGSDGMDEITTTGPTYAAILDDDGRITEKELTPQDFGVETATVESLKGGSAEENAAAIRALFDGHKSAYRDIVLANAAIVIMLHGSANTIEEGVKKAARSIDEHAARQTLRDYIMFSRSV